MATGRGFAVLLVLSVGATVALTMAGTGNAFARDGFNLEEPQDQVVLSGTVNVPRGHEVGEVVIFHGRATIEGVVHGDVVVLDGDAEIAGQVSGSVIVIRGNVDLGSGAQIRGDVRASGRVLTEQGFQVGGSIRQHVRYTLPLEIGRWASWLAVAVSTLMLGLLVLLVAPRASEAVATAALGAPWLSLGWGFAAFVGLPLLAVVAAITLVGLPFGLGLLLALAFIDFVGYAFAQLALGRLLWRAPRSRALAFLFGWAIVAAVTAIPFVGGVVWVAGAVFGLGAVSVAVWRARGTGGKHRGGKPVALLAEEEGAGL